ncbi:MAG: hypothetical protein RMN25_14150 [Anaerolineae bacterium]|nr:hypothetical protein [Thermoflexales bacterium]MDW8408912.1 hypothetical protein [Anaerolineae bacterium]
MSSATVLLAGAYVLMNGWAYAGAVLAIAALWTLGQQRGVLALASVSLVGMAALAAFGVAQGISQAAALLACVFALTTWDIDRLVHRLSSVDHVEHRDTLIHGHLYQLAVVVGLGMIVGLISGALRLNISFGVVLGLGLLALWALSRLARSAKQ